MTCGMASAVPVDLHLPQHAYLICTTKLKSEDSASCVKLALVD